MIWILPLIGAIVSASLINPVEPKGFFRHHPLIASIFGFLFIVEYKRKKNISGYPSDSNLYGPDAGPEWREINHVDPFADFGGDGGGE